MIKFLIVYLTLGVISAIGTTITLKPNKPGFMSWVGLFLFSFPGWPMWTAYLIYSLHKNWKNQIRCPWCGETVNFHNPEATKEHVKNCKDHPTLTEIARLNAIIEDYEKKEKFWNISVSFDMAKDGRLRKVTNKSQEKPNGS